MVGLDHPHALSMTALLRDAGFRLQSVWAAEPAQLEGFARLFGDPSRAAKPGEIFADPAIDLVVCAAVPDQRAALALAALRAGKHVLVDKPGVTSLIQLDELERVQRESGRRWLVCFSERLADPASVLAERLVADGAIGEVIQTIGMGPHQLGLTPRPAWFWDPTRSGGILADLAAHQIDQFLFYTRSNRAQIVSAIVANRGHPQRPDFEDVGELLLRGEHASGYARVDWYTPDGLGSWGDVRLFLLGTAGTLELRKNVDPAGRAGPAHVILVDREGTRHLEAAEERPPFATRLARDLRDGTETALGQRHAFRVTRLALEAQAQATRLGHLE